jgi:CheY-like chemotaxis protein
VHTCRDPIEVVLVEDDPGDVELTERALTSSGIRRLTVLTYGADALTHLRHVPGEAVRRPHLILLDLYLPDMSGFDLLS